MVTCVEERMVISREGHLILSMMVEGRKGGKRGHERCSLLAESVMNT